MPKLASHICRSLIAVRKPWIVARCSFSVTRFSQPLPSVAADCLIFALTARLLHIIGTCSPLTHFSLMLAVPLKRSAVIHSHIAFQCSVPVSRCSLLAAQFFCLIACSRRFSFLIFRCSLLYTQYSLLVGYALSLLRVSLIAAAALCLLLAV